MVCLCLCIGCLCEGGLLIWLIFEEMRKFGIKNEHYIKPLSLLLLFSQGVSMQINFSAYSQDFCYSGYLANMCTPPISACAKPLTLVNQPPLTSLSEFFVHLRLINIFLTGAQLFFCLFVFYQGGYSQNPGL